jgi:hypothetical protein
MGLGTATKEFLVIEFKRTQVAGSKSSNCAECNACDIIHQGCCQVCGYERPRNHTPRSNSSSDIGPTASSHGVMYLEAGETADRS